jgi:hypothetical protein
MAVQITRVKIAPKTTSFGTGQRRKLNLQLKGSGGGEEGGHGGNVGVAGSSALVRVVIARGPDEPREAGNFGFGHPRLYAKVREGVETDGGGREQRENTERTDRVALCFDCDNFWLGCTPRILI